MQLDEKLITYGNRKPYGQIVFLVGGAGGGKGFAKDNFIDSGNFKNRDVDEMKKQLQKLHALGQITIDKIIDKFGKNMKTREVELARSLQQKGYTLSKLDMRNPDHTMLLHALVKAIGIKDKTLANMMTGKSNPETLPNIIFDITAAELADIMDPLQWLIGTGYKPENIHMTWVLTNYSVAMKNNKSRPRMVPEDILLQTHAGAANTVWGLVTRALPKGMDGRVDVILNNPENTVYMKNAAGEDIVDPKGEKYPTGFKSLPVKQAGKPILPEKVWKEELFKWVKDNAPEEITSNME